MASYNNPYLNQYAQYVYPYTQTQQTPVYQPVPQAMQTPVQQNGSNGLPYVHGLEGAHAFPMPTGVNQIILWDDTDNRFYVKGYDNMGKPKILADNDFQPHVEKKAAVVESADASVYVTKDYLDKALSELKIGDQGRIVRSDEHDA